MTAAIPNLWPADLAVGVVSPRALLKTQASNLSPMTKGLLDGEVLTAAGHSQVSHRLQLIAPALNGLRRTILTVSHGRDEPYPAWVDADCFKPDEEDIERQPDVEWRPTAWTFEELLALVKKALESNHVRSAIQSLLALSSEPAAEPETATQPA